MVVSSSRKFVFLAFQKTGSTSVESALRTYESTWDALWYRVKYGRMRQRGGDIYKHLSALEAKRLVGASAWEEYTTITFVRNPWDRIVSLYSYHRQLVNKGRKWQRFALAKQSFHDWVKGGGTGSARKLMSDFVSDENGNIIVDIVGRYESLYSEYSRIARALGITGVQLSHKNRSKHENYRNYYNDETRGMVTEWVKRDADLFGYEF